MPRCVTVATKGLAAAGRQRGSGLGEKGALQGLRVMGRH